MNSNKPKRKRIVTSLLLATTDLKGVKLFKSDLDEKHQTILNATRCHRIIMKRK